MNARLHPALAAALLPFAPPSSVVHKIISEDKALQADLHFNHLKNSGALDRRNDDQAMRLQQRFPNPWEPRA